MIILGLTGSIAMGKSTVAAMMRDRGIAVHDSDAYVRHLLDGNLTAIIKAFPESYNGEAIDREKLGDITFNDAKQREKLEAILHPLVKESRDEFIAECKENGKEIICFDVPLLFETGIDKQVDYTITVDAPVEIQRVRALSRPNMSAQKFEAILKTQIPNIEKCARSDYTINTGVDIAHSMKDLNVIIADIKEKHGL